MEERKAQIDTDYARANQSLDNYYEAHKEQWVKELVERTIAE